MSSLGGRLKSLRVSKGISQRDAARRLGILNTQLSRYESDVRRPDPEMLTKLAEFYETSGSYLLGLTDDPSTDTSGDMEEKVIEEVSERDKMSLREIEEMILNGQISDELSEQDKIALARYIRFLRNDSEDN